MREPIQVVLADESPIGCRLLKSCFEEPVEFEAVGTALNGARALEAGPADAALPPNEIAEQLKSMERTDLDG